MIAERSLRIARCTLSAFALALAVTNEAAAQSNNQVAAESLFRDARRLLDEGKYKEACEKLATSQRLDPAVGTLLNLGRCYEKTGQVASAWGAYREAVSMAKSKGQADRAKSAAKAADALEPTLPRLIINVAAGSPSDLKIQKDGAPVPPDAYGVSIPVDPGKHTIDASASGKVSFSAKVEVPLRTEKAVAVPLLQDEAKAATPVVKTTPPAVVTAPPTSGGEPGADVGTASSSGFWNGQRTLGAVLGGVGVAGVAIGVVEGLRFQSKKSDAEDLHCLPGCGDETKVKQTGALLDDASSARTIGIISGAVGGASLVTGIVLFATAGGSKNAEARRFEVTPIAGLSDVGVRVRGSF